MAGEEDSRGRIASSDVTAWVGPAGATGEAQDRRRSEMENDTRSGRREGELVVRCECGFEACATEANLVPIVQRHGRESHNMDVTREQVLAMARPA